MKLKCFGDNTCPDWVLAGLYATSELSAPKTKSLVMIIAEHLTGEQLQEDNIKMILADVKKDSVTDMKSVIASIIFVLRNATKWGSDGSQLDADLRIVGVASVITRSLRMALDTHGQEIEAKMKKETLTFSKLNDVSCSVPTDGSIDCIQLNLNIHDVLEKRDDTHSILIQQRDLSEFIDNLKKARSLME